MPPSSWIILASYLALLGVLALYGSHRVAILLIYRRLRDANPRTWDWPELPGVTVQLPVYNERNVVERLIDAAAGLEWPRDRLQIQVLDDSTDDTADVAARVAAAWRERGVDVRVLRREDRTGYKAGALAAGLATATGELVAVFDADFIPQPSFIREVVPYFDPSGEIGMVQARWGHLNEDVGLLTRLESVLLDGHFVLEHTARNRSGRFFNFNGTAGVWRRACISDAGGWQHDTVTEDLDLSYRAQLRGWRFVYLRDCVVPSELPSTMRAFKNQQHRWAKGSIQTARKLLPGLLRSDLPGRVKREAFVHLTNNLAYPLVLALGLLMPFAIDVRGQGDLGSLLLFDLPVFLAATGSVALFYGATLRELGPGWGRGLWRLPLVLALGVGMAVNQTRAVFEGLFGQDVTFVRTPKRGEIGRTGGATVRLYEQVRGWTPLVELGLGVYFTAAIVWAGVSGHWGSVPFLALFAGGYGYVGLASLRSGRVTADDARLVEVVVEAGAA